MSNSKMILNSAIVIAVIGLVAFLIYNAVQKTGVLNQQNPVTETSQDSIGGIPVQENTFHISEKTAEVIAVAASSGVAAKDPKFVQEFDVSGDGVPEGVYATDAEGEFALFMQGEKDTVVAARVYAKIQDPVEAGKVLILKKNAKMGYFHDIENHVLVQYDLRGGCELSVYKWEQVQRGFVTTNNSGATNQQRETYCAKAVTL